MLIKLKPYSPIVTTLTGFIQPCWNILAKKPLPVQEVLIVNGQKIYVLSSIVVSEDLIEEVIQDEHSKSQ